MKSIQLLSVILFLIIGNACGQSNNYYVKAKQLNLRAAATEQASVVGQLKQFDNLIVMDSTSFPGWFKVKKGKKEGFVFKKYVAPGKAVITYSYTRTGARCKDGSKSFATGRGACSRHGGVREWLTEKKPNVFIQRD